MYIVSAVVELDPYWPPYFCIEIWPQLDAELQWAQNLYYNQTPEGALSILASLLEVVVLSIFLYSQ